MTKKEAISLLQRLLIVNQKEREAVSMAVKALEVQNDEWIEIIEDDPDTFPPVDEEGCSEYVLLSFSNTSFVCIGEYRTDLEGGAFYDGDDDRPLNSFGLIVNAWRPLPERFKGEE